MVDMPRVMTFEDVEALAIGGTILGGGGGGWPEIGRRDGFLALQIGKVELWGPDEADPEWKVITSAALGAPTEPGDTKPMHFIKAAQLLRDAGVEFHGVIAAENGGQNSFGGWVIAAALGLPVVDTPGDGRAHPTAMMGSMGLHRLDYKSVKTGVTEGSEVIAWGSLQSTSNVIRAQARDTKALIAMARDPVPVSYTKAHGAPGAISMAIELGKTWMKADKPDAKVKAATKFLRGKQICKGEIIELTIEAKGGFDVGIMTIREGDDEWELSYVNEYMTLEKEGKRLATFPDLMTTFKKDGSPVTSAALEEGQTVYLVNVPKEKIPVGDGNKYPEIYAPIEAVLGKPMVKHLSGYLKP
ncbi:MAG: DUF917 family protein [Candidatus Bathyarchaeota archaeon]|nr:DUF917 family protein [Candidatus Bathyarchaeota archaeon]